MFEKFKDFGTKLGHQSLSFFKSLSVGRKFFLGAILAAFFIALSLLSLWEPEKTYVVAYEHITDEDKLAILAKLREKNMTDVKVNGETISFPKDKILDYKMLLAQDGLPKSGVGVGWEKFDQSSFGVSDFEQRINKIRALQGEISRTINRLDSVESSRVHIVLLDTDVFSDDKHETTASIFVRLIYGKTLSRKQIQGIMHLAANAVEGLKPQQISIVDQDGNMLTDNDDIGGVDKVTHAQRKYQRQVERELESKIKEILARVVGYDKVVAKVQASIDFKKVETTISDVDPDRTAVIASQKTEQETKGSGLNPTGVPGAKSNLPGEKPDLDQGLSNSSTSNTENLNFEVKKTLSKIIEPIGQVKKITASVLVDDKDVNGEIVPRTDEEIKRIESLVKNAIGFVEKRDDLTVESTKFAMDRFEEDEKATLTARQAKLIQTAIIGLISILGMIFLYILFVKPYFKWLMHDPEKRSKEEFEVSDYEIERIGPTARRVQQEEEIPFDKMSPKEQIFYLARHDPKKTTEAIRQLLSPSNN